MGRRDSGNVLSQIHTLFSAGTFSGHSDGQLLEQFVAGHQPDSEAAFAALVERHGPMVLGVCRRALADNHEAEDAFQATFLVLVQKAGSIQCDGSVGRWLYGVATRVAAHARADARRRGQRERTGTDRLDLAACEPHTNAVDQADLQSILADELGRLPGRFQAPILLCDLEGSSQEEAARQLGWPVGTVKSRLSRARARLRVRLARRGLAPRDLSTVLPFLSSGLPPSLVTSTMTLAETLITRRLGMLRIVPEGAPSLTEGVLRAMLFTRVKLALTALVLVLTGSAILVRHATAQKPPERQRAASERAALVGENSRSNDELDVVMLERAWADAIPRRDDAVVDRILADGFKGVDSHANVFSKATYLRDLRDGVFSAAPIEIDEINTQIFGETVVVTMRLMTKIAPTWGRRTNVYVKWQGRWQCVASHSSSSGGTALDLVPTPAAGQSAAPTPGQMTGRDNAAAQRLIRIRPRFECLVEKVRVRVGESVKRGDLLIDLFSTDLAAAKNDFQARKVHWENATRTLKLRERLHAQNAIAQQLLVDTQNDENRARLEYETARAKLQLLGVDIADIDRTAKQEGDDKARLTWRSPADGTVIEVGAELGNLYDKNDVLMVIRTRSRDAASRP